MKLRALVPFVLVVGLYVSRPAQAHIHLDAPKDAITTDATGNPQKEGPCGSTAGTPSGVVTKLKAGSKFTVKWTDTIAHPGHYRISLGKTVADFKDPDMTVTDGQCISATVQDPPVKPVLLDGIAPAADGAARAAGGAAHQAEITVPTEACDNCVLQVIQFMTEHGAPCVYYHCAAVQIVADLATPSQEVNTSTSSSSSSTTGGTTSGTSATPTKDGGSSSNSADSTSSSSGNSRRLSSTPAESDGCNVGGNDWTYAPLALVGLATISRLRRRRARR